MKQNLIEILQKEMSRKEFLQTLGIGAATMLGMSSIMHLLGVKHPLLNRSIAEHGFGGGPYGR